MQSASPVAVVPELVAGATQQMIGYCLLVPTPIQLVRHYPHSVAASPQPAPLPTSLLSGTAKLDICPTPLGMQPTPLVVQTPQLVVLPTQLVVQSTLLVVHSTQPVVQPTQLVAQSTRPVVPPIELVVHPTQLVV